MKTTAISLLIVEDDPGLCQWLSSVGTARGFRTACAKSLADTARALEGHAFAAAVVDLGLSSESGFDVMRLLKERAPDTEIVVISASGSLASAIQSYDMAAFAFVQKPFAEGQMFSTLDRALERRQMNLDNRRLVWELQTVNEIADGIARSLELKDVLAGALARLVRALSLCGGSIRLKDERTGRYEEQAMLGHDLIKQLWEGGTVPASVMRPSDQVLATGEPVVVEDLAAIAGGDPSAWPVRSALSVPMRAGEELVGTLSVGAATPGRFIKADQRLLEVIAGQISLAVQNARLHDTIRRGKREWERTFDAISDPIALFDSEERVLRGNAALATQLDIPLNELRGRTCREIWSCLDACSECPVTCALRSESSRREMTLPNGQIFSVTTFPVAGGPNRASVVQVAKNVTEEIRSARRLQQMSEELALANARAMAALDRLKSTQAQLLQAEKLSAIGQLVAGVAHELNNPLTSVIGYAQLLEEELRDRQSPESRPRSELAEDLRRIAEESERAARIVRNLLAFARRQAAERAPQDVADLFSRVLALRSYELRLNNVQVETEFENRLPPVIVDGSQLQQALLNLLLNAEQAMRGRPSRQLRVGARYDSAAAAVELFVTDSGHGIEHANLMRIFDPFFTTRDVGEGTGLGLSICYGIVRDHGGQILVDSKVDVGTTFSVLLPALAEGSRHEDVVLVAHADTGQRDYLAAALGAWGYTVATAATAAEAIESCRARQLLCALVDRALIASDLDAWRQARSVDQPCPLVLVTMGADETDVERFGRECGNHVLTPPFQLRALRAVVDVISKECV